MKSFIKYFLLLLLSTYVLNAKVAVGAICTAGSGVDDGCTLNLNSLIFSSQTINKETKLNKYVKQIILKIPNKKKIINLSFFLKHF